jgi:hypothetical protein
MTKYAVVHGRTVIVRGRRHFAIPKPVGTAQAIAERTTLRGNWERIETQPRGARVIINHHR